MSSGGVWLNVSERPPNVENTLFLIISILGKSP